MKRVAHIMQPLKAGAMPKRVIFFDTETFEEKISDTKRRLRLKLGYAVLARRKARGGFRVESQCEFHSTDTFLRWLDRKATGKERIYIVAHNIGFDVRVVGLMRFLAFKRWKRTSLIFEGINFMASFRKGETTLQLMNNQQLFNTSLKSLGESIGTYKAQVDFRTATNDELMEYCKQDVMVMLSAWNTWVSFLQDNDLGPFKMTAASTALAAFRYRFMQHNIYIHNDDRTIALERESYHGGRVECFFRGTWRGGAVYNVDINSMYPFIMKEHDFPTKLLKYHRSISLRRFLQLREKHGYIVEATLRVRRPVLPSVSEGRLVFGVGEITGVFAKPELEHALQYGDLLRVHRCAFYDESPIFGGFVDFFYGARKKFSASGNDAFAYVSKLLLNSLYGKFGQKQNVWKMIGKSAKHNDGYYKTWDDTKKDWIKLRIIDGIVERAVGFEEGYNSFVAIASYVTASARVYLSTLLELAGQGNVLYCDTDSLFLTAEGYANLTAFMHKDELGKLKLVAVSPDVEIYGPKWYRFAAKEKAKGIRKDAVLVGERTFSQDRFQSFVGALGEGNLDGVVIDTIHKELQLKYAEGRIDSQGWISPLNFPPLDRSRPAIPVQHAKFVL